MWGGEPMLPTQLSIVSGQIWVNGLILCMVSYKRSTDIAGHDFRSLKVKANQIAELMEYTDMQIGQSLGILKQSNLVKC